MSSDRRVREGLTMARGTAQTPRTRKSQAKDESATSVIPERPSTPDEGNKNQPAAHDQWWSWLRWIDPGKPPLTVLRWLAVLGIALAWWAQGAPTTPVHAWVPYVVIAGILILPDIAGFAVGGFKLDLKQARDDIAALRQEVNAQARASSMSVLAIGDEAIEKLAPPLERATAKVTHDQATGLTPWSVAEAVDDQPKQDLSS